tara:strand:+ start:900 stop:2429 length:1530 start_codon:yes stop_codon:yes gene_type:complete
MKNTLVRLTTTDNKGNFDCDFQDDIVITENTEIALHSLSVERQNKSLAIDSSNDTITFQVSNNAGVHSVALDHGQISTSNFADTIRTLTDRMNSTLRFFRGTPAEIEDGDNKNTKETGMQIKVSTNVNKNVLFDFRYAECITALTANADDLLTTHNINTASNEFKVDDGNSGTIDNLTHSLLAFKDPISLGTHISRLRIKKFQNNNGDNSGFTMGITTNLNAIVNNSLTLNDLDYGIRIKQNTSVIEVKNGKANDFANNAVGRVLTNFTGNTGDCLSFEVREDVIGEGQKLIMRHYTSGGNKGTTLLKADITLRDGNNNDIPYYFVVSLCGNSDNIKVDHLGSCRNQFFKSSTDKNGANELTLPATLPLTSRDATLFNLTMPSTLADFFGFDNATIDANAIDTVFTGNRQFEQIVGSDNYIIEMLNMPINTYDALRKGRKNILAYVPVSETIIDDATGIVQYEPKERLFLPLANKFAETLRNIRARIVASDFSTIETEGLSSLNIILRD